MLTRGARWIFLALLATAVGCDRASPAADPEAEVAEEVEPLEPALLQNLPEGIAVETVQDGRRSYAVCSVCHGLDGRGTQLGPSLRSAEWLHIDGSIEQIESVIREGVARPLEYPVPMPVLGGGDFDATELRALALYVHLLGRSGV